VSESAAEPWVPNDKRALIAVDLGAESCRVSLLRWIDGKPETTLVHRLPNAPVAADDGSLRWPLGKIAASLEQGIRECAAIAQEGVRAVAVDGWAVDYVRLGQLGEPLAEPFCYRDERTVEAERLLHERISPARMREITGVQQLRLNTVYQLYADRLSNQPPGSGWVNLPEYMLSRWGAAPVSEYTNASHTQMVDIESGAWSEEIFAAAGLDLSQAQRIVPPGTRLGRIEGPLSEVAALRDAELIAPACHDTASALAGIAGLGENWAYISSGTWSLVGTLMRRPLMSEAVRKDNFTNFAGVGGNTCFHRNINGMWMVKQCMDTWAGAGANLSLGDLLVAAEQLEAPADLMDVDDPELLLVGQMPQRINAQRVRRGLAKLDESPGNAAAVIGLILHSLAARYAEVMERVEHHSGKALERIFVVGGGSRNSFLNRLTARATGLKVVCGPAESSTIGNFAVQMAVLESSHAVRTQEFAQDVARWAATLHPRADWGTTADPSRRSG
jgi:rhamnulokinase